MDLETRHVIHFFLRNCHLIKGAVFFSKYPVVFSPSKNNFGKTPRKLSTFGLFPLSSKTCAVRKKPAIQSERHRSLEKALL